MKVLISLFLIFLCSGSVFAYGYGNRTYVQNGNIISGSDGSQYVRNGNIVYGNNGSQYVRNGNIVYQQQGYNNYNQAYTPDYSSKQYCNTINGKTYCN